MQTGDPLGTTSTRTGYRVQGTGELRPEPPIRGPLLLAPLAARPCVQLDKCTLCYHLASGIHRRTELEFLVLSALLFYSGFYQKLGILTRYADEAAIKVCTVCCCAPTNLDNSGARGI